MGMAKQAERGSGGTNAEEREDGSDVPGDGTRAFSAALAAIGRRRPLVQGRLVSSLPLIRRGETDGAT